MRLEVRELLKIAFGVCILVALACSKNDPLKVYRYYAVEDGSSNDREGTPEKVDSISVPESGHKLQGCYQVL